MKNRMDKNVYQFIEGYKCKSLYFCSKINIYMVILKKK